jgi:dienelactone hydrolase
MASEHTAKAFDSDLQELTRLVAEMGGLAERMIADSVDSLVRRDVALSKRVVGNIRRFFWPILAQTAEETPKVIDWAIKTLKVRKEVGMGGISMGGDISVAAASVDRRIKAVSACVATPDWMRPGSIEPPAEPDAAAQADYDRRNPLTHLKAYRHRPAIAFQSGADDKIVPSDGATRFVDVTSEATGRLVYEAIQAMGVAVTPSI